MNREEKVAKQYLERLALGEVKYEPDGNIPPDFSLPASIAVEVRRLNQNYFRSVKASGLEEVFFPLLAKLRKVLNSFDNQFNGNSYWVGLTYKRPLQGGVKGTGEQIREALDLFLRNPGVAPCEIKVNDTSWLDIWPATPNPNRVFRHGISSDYDSDGPVVQIYSRNISYCIEEKRQKVALHKPHYDEWWLLLVDTIMCWQLMPHEVNQVRAAITNHQGFDRVILIDYHGKECLLEIP